MTGEIVLVEEPAVAGVDEFNAIIYGKSGWSAIDNVLVSPSSTDNVTDTNRPDGKIVVYTLHFPKTFDESLKGKKINVRGEVYKVIGDPKHYSAQATPGQWWMPVKVEATDG